MKRMKAAAILITLLACIAADPAPAQLIPVWSRTYGGASSDGFRAAIRTRDAGYLAVGYTYSFGAGDADLFVVKTDALGDSLWTRTFGGPEYDCGSGVCETPDGGCVIAGYTRSYGAGLGDVYVVKIDAAGDSLWTRTYGGSALDEGRSICATAEGLLFVAGETESYGAGESDAYLLQLNADGDTVWTRTFGGAASDWADGVCLTTDGCCCASGTTGSFNSTRDVYLIKVDASGTLVWEHNYGSATQYREDFGTGVCALADGRIAATGWRTDQDNLDPSQVTLLTVDAGGVQQSYRRYPHPYIEYGSAICPTADGGTLICGSMKSTETQRNDLFLVRRDTSAWQWTETFGDDGSDWGCSVSPCGPDHFVIAGYTQDPESGVSDGWLLHVHEGDASWAPETDGPTGLRLDLPRPNPANPGTLLRFTLPERAAVDLAILDVTGRRVRSLAAAVFEAGDHAMTWSGRDELGAPVATGVYLARLQVGSEVVTRKVVRID